MKDIVKKGLMFVGAIAVAGFVADRAVRAGYRCIKPQNGGFAIGCFCDDESDGDDSDTSRQKESSEIEFDNDGDMPFEE